MAITRNASESLETLIFGIDLKPGDEVIQHEPELPAHDHVLGAARPARRASSSSRSRFPVPPPSPAAVVDALPQGDHAAHPRHRGHAHHEPDRPDPARCATSCALGREHGHRGVRGRRPRLRALPVQARRPRVRLLRARACTSGSSRRSARDSSTCARTSRRRSGRSWRRRRTMDENIRKYEEIGTHPAANHNAIAAAHRVPPRDRRGPQGRAPALPARPLGRSGWPPRTRGSRS